MCGDRFGPGHVCKNKGIYMLLVNEEDGVDNEVEIIKYKGVKTLPDVELPLHSVTGDLLSSIVKMAGIMQDSEIAVLLDEGVIIASLRPQ